MPVAKSLLGKDFNSQKSAYVKSSTHRYVDVHTKNWDVFSQTLCASCGISLSKMVKVVRKNNMYWDCRAYIL